jgi:DNA-binding NtrC family response regulator
MAAEKNISNDCNHNQAFAAKGESMTRSVLVVDDDAAALDEMAEALGNEAIKIFVASNAIEALELAREFRPGFVLMDFNLPGMNGIEAIGAIQTFLPKATFIMISGLDDFCRVATTENTHSFAILQKPVSIHNIARYIRNVFQQTGDKALNATEMLMA